MFAVTIANARDSSIQRIAELCKTALEPIKLLNKLSWGALMPLPIHRIQRTHRIVRITYRPRLHPGAKVYWKMNQTVMRNLRKTFCNSCDRRRITRIYYVALKCEMQ